MAKRNIIVLLVALFICHFQMIGENPVTNTLNSGGKERTYQVYEPSSIDDQTSIMLCLHGLGGKSSDFFNTFDITDLAKDLNMVIVAPQALKEQDPNVEYELSRLPSSIMSGIKLNEAAAWGAGLYIDATYTSNGNTLIKAELNASVNDVAFLKEVLTKIKGQYSQINTKRIFVLGVSMGGFMAYQYAMYYSDELTGLIAVSGSMGTHIKNKTGAKPLAICDFHSVDDDVVPYAGGKTVDLGGMLGTAQVTLAEKKEDVISFWNKLNHPSGSTIAEKIFPPENGKTVTKYTYSSQRGKDVIHYKITGANHTYFFDKANGDAMDYIDEVKDFILAAKLAGIDKVYAERMDIYPNPAHDIIYLPTETGKITICDLAGKTVLAGNVSSLSFNISSLTKGIYVVKLQTEQTTYVTKLQVE